MLQSKKPHHLPRQVICKRNQVHLLVMPNLGLVKNFRTATPKDSLIYTLNSQLQDQEQHALPTEPAKHSSTTNLKKMKKSNLFSPRSFFFPPHPGRAKTMEAQFLLVRQHLAGSSFYFLGKSNAGNVIILSNSRLSHFSK